MRGYAADVSPSLLPVAATLLALAGVRDGETVVDVGCGTGLLTHAAAAASGPGGRVCGVDTDAALLALARARRASDVCWVLGDPARLPVAAGKVDKVLCGPVLHRLADLDATLAEWRRVLVPGGRAAVGAWGEFADDAAEAAVRAVAGEPGAGAARAAAELPGLLAAAGLRVGHVSAEDVAVPFAGGAEYAAWRLSFLPGGGGEGAAARLAGSLGPEPVVARARIHYVTATGPG